MLDQFRNRWNSENGSIHRDTAHLFTGTELDGNIIGIAYIGVICSGNYGYGLSQTGVIPQISWRDTSLTAHEVGHNWNAEHCNGDPDCGVMCSGIGGCGPLDIFGSALGQCHHQLPQYTLVSGRQRGQLFY